MCVGPSGIDEDGVADIPREELDLLFESHDKDQNGKLSWQEFSGQESKNERAFKLMDADHNGKITKNVSLIDFCSEEEIL